MADLYDLRRKPSIKPQIRARRVLISVNIAPLFFLNQSETPFCSDQNENVCVNTLWIIFDQLLSQSGSMLAVFCSTKMTFNSGKIWLNISLLTRLSTASLLIH